MPLNLFQLFFFISLFINSTQYDEYEFIDLKNKNSTICDLRITTDNLVIFDKCILSEEWKLFYKKTTSESALQVYEKVSSIRRVFNIEYITDIYKNQKDMKFKKISIDVYENKNYLNDIKISNKFPYILKKGDNFDIIIEYNNYNLTYVDIVISVFIVNNINSKYVELNFGYRKIVTNEFIQKIDLSYLFLTMFFLVFIFLVRKKYLIEENEFIRIHIEEIMQIENAEEILVIMGIILTVFLFFIIIKYTYYIAFIFSILLCVLSIKSFFKYLFNCIIPFSSNFDNKYIHIKKIKIEYSNIIFYPMSIFVIIYWYYITNDFFYLHTLLNDVIFFIVVYFIIHKYNIKNFFIIMIISFSVIIFQLIQIIIDENTKQEDDNNVFYITTRFIIDVPIRFIMFDLVDSPFQEIYFFSFVDIVLICLLIHYCEYTYHLSKIYLMISIYGTILGLILNMIIFYRFNFSPPMSLIPLFLTIISLLFYSIYQKQFFNFVDLEPKESEELREIMEIQEMQDIPAQINFSKKTDLSFRSFNEDEQFFEEEKNMDKLKEKDSLDEEDKFNLENIINYFNDKFYYNKNYYELDDDSEIEGIVKLFDLVGEENKENLKTPAFSRKKDKNKNMDIINNSDINIFNNKKNQRIEMIEFKSN